jgi:gamma-tubulin complex component 3
MAAQQRTRVTNAIDSLITHLVPANTGDDPDNDDDRAAQAARDRHEACFELVRNIFDR